MIRVALIVAFSDQGWLGGVSYFRNLLRAVESLEQRAIEPVLFISPQTDRRVLAGYPPFEMVCSTSLASRGVAWTTRRVWAKARNRDSALERLMRRHRIDVLSHHGFLAGMGDLPIIAWIPDFQELHLPEFFSPAERAARARKLSLACAVARTILVSSEDAQHDLRRSAPEFAERSRVLRFVANPAYDLQLPDTAALESKYGFSGRYFHLPNQYWAHKNHRAVIEALAILKASGRSVQVLATGNSDDHRQPGYFASLAALTQSKGVTACFRSLGVVPQADLVGLMCSSVALINPSLFEGWSTTVEEAKSLGKHILLSDIAVHREQSPARGTYFDPHDPTVLAEQMWSAWNQWDPAVEERERELARRALTHRIRSFALDYQGIVVEAARSRVAA